MAIFLIYILPMIFVGGTAISVRLLFVEENGEKVFNRFQTIGLVLLSLIPYLNLLIAILTIIAIFLYAEDIEVKSDNKIIKWLLK